MSILSQPTINFPPGVRLDLWGPSLIPGGKFYIFQGQKKRIPVEWRQDTSRFLKELRIVERIQWSYAYPEKRMALFKEQLHVITRNLPSDWTIVVCTVASGLIILAGVVSTVQSQISKL
jgi:hypothetical protein